MPRGFSDYDTAKLQGRLWTPAVLRPGVWFDAADISTISISTGVSTWSDKSGNGRNATQATGGKQPIYTASALNGLPAVVLDGTDDQLNYDGSFVSGGAYTFILAHRRTKTGRNYLFGGTTASAPPDDVNFIIGGYNLDTTFRFAQYAGFSLDATVPAYSAPDPPRIMAARSNPSASSQTLFLNGAQVATNTSSAATNNGAASLGRYGSPDEFGACEIYEMLLFAVDLFRPNMQAIEGYIGWKWGIPLAADHPYVNRPPLIGD